MYISCQDTQVDRAKLCLHKPDWRLGGKIWWEMSPQEIFCFGPGPYIVSCHKMHTRAAMSVLRFGSRSQLRAHSLKACRSQHSAKASRLVDMMCRPSGPQRNQDLEQTALKMLGSVSGSMHRCGSHGCCEHRPLGSLLR